MLRQFLKQADQYVAFMLYTVLLATHNVPGRIRLGLG